MGKIKLLTPPKVCDNCKKEFGDRIYDAKTCYGPWGYLCEACFNTIGVGLGTGLGQMYKKNEANEWIKVAG